PLNRALRLARPICLSIQECVMNINLAPVLAVLTALAGGTATAAAETPPAATVFEEDGSIAQSLSGAPGDPQAGRQTMEARGLGNCYACHLVEATPDIQFMGDIGPALDGA